MAATRFVFEGLGLLMEHLLVTHSRHIRFANEFGVKKIIRNIVALQQSLKAITDDQKDAEFERAKRYYGLFWSGAAVSRFRCVAHLN